MRFRRILCAFDDSPSARAALAFATQLAEDGANLRLARVVERDRVVADIGTVPGAAQMATEAMAAAERSLELAREAAAKNVPGAEAVTLGATSVWRPLIAEAKRWHPDLVVIGAGSRRGGILGPVAQRLVRQTSCAVLVVSGVPGRLSKILCAVDFSSPSREAMEVAVEIAGKRGAQVTLAHVTSELDRAVLGQAGSPAGVRDGRDSAEETLRRWAAEVNPGATSRPAVEVVEGRPADAIIQLARVGDFDLIVVGSHGRSGIERVLIGSVAEEIVRRADRSVLILRRPAAIERATSRSGAKELRA